MKVYLLWWDNGESYEDYVVELLGIYSSPELRDAAKKRLQRFEGWPVCWSPDREKWNRDAQFRDEEWSMDADLYPRR